MKDWFKQKHHQVACLVWFAGLLAAYIAAAHYTFEMLSHGLRGMTLLVMMVTALPLGFGILKRRMWAKWALMAVMVFMVLPPAIGVTVAPSFIGIVGLLSFVSCMVSMIRWDITGEQETEERREWFDRLIEQKMPPPLASSSVTLECAVGKPLSKQILAAAVTQAFGRQCKISESTDNIDLGVESAFTTVDTAVVGGVESESFVHLIVGAKPVSFEVMWMGFTGETSGGALTISTPRQSLGHEAEIDGYDWTIPLAAALWSEKIICAKPENEDQSLTSVAALLEWNANRKN